MEKPCKTIYEVIENEYFQESEVFTKEFLKFCDDHPNETQFIHKKTKKYTQKIGL